VTEHGEDRQLKRYELLTDIIGSEDHFGDMDFAMWNGRGRHWLSARFETSGH
jgi:hypothetical protein